MVEPAATAVLLLLNLAWGLALVFRAPPFASMDEPFHWLRAVQVSELHLLARRLGPNDWGGRVDAAAVGLIAPFAAPFQGGEPIAIATVRGAAAALDATPRGSVTASFPSTASFSPVPYAPAALGIAVARGWGWGVLAQYHAGRVGNLLGYLVLISLTAVLLPIGRLAALAMLSFPTAIGLAAAISPDPVNTGVIAVFAACCVRLHVDPRARVRSSYRVALPLLGGSLALLKPISVVFAGAILLVPSRAFALGARGRAVCLTSVLLLAAGVAVAWSLAYPFVPGPYWHTGADPGRAAAILRADPFGAVLRTLRQITLHGGFFLRDSYGRFGGHPGSYSFTLSPNLCWAGFAGTLGLAVAGTCGPPRAGAAVLLASIAVLYVGLVILAFRVTFNAPGSDLLVGEQGRYLHPAELLTVLALALAAPLAWLPRLLAARPRRCILVAAYLLAVAAQSAIMTEAVGRYGRLWH